MISIIIPVYNGAEYIKECYNSLLNQSYQVFEIIFVDDGSIDDSILVLKKLADGDTRIKLVIQPNRGVIYARARGVEEASSEYILFLDIDDILPCETLAIYENSVLNSDADIFIGSMNLLKGTKTIKRINREYDKEINTSEQYIKKLLVSGGWELCGKLYKKNLFIDDIIYPYLRIGEDAAILFQLIIRADIVCFLKDITYNYIVNDLSASNIQSEEYAKEGLKAAVFIEEILNKKYVYPEINSMYLLFYSNSLRRGILTKNDLLVKGVAERMSIKALRDIGLVRSIYIICSYYGGKHFQIFCRKYLLK